jgi:hypothetical protein
MPNFSKDGKLKSDQLKEFLKNSIEYNRKNITYDKHYLTNTKKIEGGTKFLLKWWHNLPEESKPKKFNIITDIPFITREDKYSLFAIFGILFVIFLLALSCYFGGPPCKY